MSNTRTDAPLLIVAIVEKEMEGARLQGGHKREEGGGRMGERNERLLKGGSCESLIPELHQLVQIWSLVPSHEALSSRPTTDQRENQRVVAGWK